MKKELNEDGYLDLTENDIKDNNLDIDKEVEEEVEEKQIIDKKNFEGFDEPKRFAQPPIPKEKKDSTFQKLEKKGTNVLNVLDKITVGVEKANSKLNVGDRVKITNGPFTDQVLIITGFVVGGVQGQVKDGSLINIRHGSYLSEQSY